MIFTDAIRDAGGVGRIRFLFPEIARARNWLDRPLLARNLPVWASSAVFNLTPPHFASVRNQPGLHPLGNKTL